MFEYAVLLAMTAAIGVMGYGLARLAIRIGVADLLGFGDEPEWLDPSDNALNSRM